MSDVLIEDEIQIGPILFEWERNGMTVSIGEEAVGYCEFVSEDNWKAFVQAAKSKVIIEGEN